MASPTVVARTASEQSTNAAGITVGLGSPSAGELLVAFISIDGAAGTDITRYEIDHTVSGHRWWLAAKVLSNLAVTGLVAIKVAEGGDALRISFGDGDAQQASAITFRISGHGGYASVSSSTGSSTNGDPASVSITGSAQDCLFLAALCADGQTIATGAPSGYSNLTTHQAANGTGASVSVADRAANASSDDPGAFTNVTDQWVAFSVAIPEFAITTNSRQTQETLETVSVVDAAAAITQVVVESITSNVLNMTVTQVTIECVSPYVASTSTNKYRMIQVAC